MTATSPRIKSYVLGLQNFYVVKISNYNKKGWPSLASGNSEICFLIYLFKTSALRGILLMCCGALSEDLNLEKSTLCFYLQNRIIISGSWILTMVLLIFSTTLSFVSSISHRNITNTRSRNITITRSRNITINRSRNITITETNLTNLSKIQITITNLSKTQIYFFKME